MKLDIKLMFRAGAHGYNNSLVCDNNTMIAETYCWLFILALSVPSAVLDYGSFSNKQQGLWDIIWSSETPNRVWRTKLLIDHLYKTDVEPPSKTTNTNLISNIITSSTKYNGLIKLDRGNPTMYFSIEYCFPPSLTNICVNIVVRLKPNTP